MLTDLTHGLPASVLKVVLLTDIHHHTGKIPISSWAAHWVAVSPFWFTQCHHCLIPWHLCFPQAKLCPWQVSRSQVVFMLPHSLPCFSDEIITATLPSGFLIFIPPAQTCCSAALVNSSLIIILFKSGITFGSFLKEKKTVPFYFPYFKLNSTEPLSHQVVLSKEI